MDGTTEGSVAAPRPAATGRPRLAVGLDGVAPAEGKAEIEQNMAQRVMPTGPDVAGSVVSWLPSELARSPAKNPCGNRREFFPCPDRTTVMSSRIMRKQLAEREHP